MTSITVEEEYVLSSYNNISEQFDQSRDRIWKTTKQQFLFLFKELSTIKFLRIVELGCGNGRNLIAFKNMYSSYKSIEQQLEIIAIEPCEKLHKIMQSKNKINNFFFDHIINCGHFSDKLNQFKNTNNLVLSVAVIHHLSSIERRILAIQELVSLAVANGYIIIQVMALHPERCNDGWKILNEKTNDFLIPWIRTGDYRYYHLFEKGELENLIHQVDNVKIIHSFEDRSNYGVVLQKQSKNIKNDIKI